MRRARLSSRQCGMSNSVGTGQSRRATEGSDTHGRPSAYWPGSLRRSIIDHLAVHLPNEGSCLLVGRRSWSPAGGLHYAIRSYIACWNPVDTPRRFVITRLAWERATREARAVSESVVGLCHSHPTAPPQPTLVDLRGASRGRSLLHVIVSFSGIRRAQDAPIVCAYRYRIGGSPYGVQDVNLYEIPADDERAGHYPKGAVT